MAIIRVIGEELWQWDTGRKVLISLPCSVDIKRVDFEGEAISNNVVLSTDVYEEDNKKVADIPNIFLQTSSDIKVYAVMEHSGGERTVFERTLSVRPKRKPSDYTYTETEIRNYDVLKKYVFEKEMYMSVEENTGYFATEQFGIDEKTLEFSLDRVPAEVSFVPTVTAWCSLLTTKITVEGMKVSVLLQIGGFGNTSYANVGGYLLYRSNKDADAEAFEEFKALLDEINGELV